MARPVATPCRDQHEAHGYNRKPFRGSRPSGRGYEVCTYLLVDVHTGSVTLHYQTAYILQRLGSNNIGIFSQGSIKSGSQGPIANHYVVVQRPSDDSDFQRIVVAK